LNFNRWMDDAQYLSRFSQFTLNSDGWCWKMPTISRINEWTVQWKESQQMKHSFERRHLNSLWIVLGTDGATKYFRNLEISPLKILSALRILWKTDFSQPQFFSAEINSALWRNKSYSDPAIFRSSLDPALNFSRNLIFFSLPSFSHLLTSFHFRIFFS
jgi:hypothetical protein